MKKKCCCSLLFYYASTCFPVTAAHSLLESKGLIYVITRLMRIRFSVPKQKSLFSGAGRIRLYYQIGCP